MTASEHEPHVWARLIDEAKGVIRPRTITKYVEAGSVGAAILTDRGNIYTGVCMDTACSLGMCAERNAIANMITNGESRITKLVCLGSGHDLMLPCGACRELMMQLDCGEMEILTDTARFDSVTLKDLTPDWWGG